MTMPAPPPRDDLAPLRSVVFGFGVCGCPIPPPLKTLDMFVPVDAAGDGVRLRDTASPRAAAATPGQLSEELLSVVAASRDVLHRPDPELLDQVAARALLLPRSQRWREAVRTALIGNWSDPLWDTGHLPVTALGVLKAQARAVHRQLGPVWKRRTRHGRVLSLDADLRDGLSLHDLVAADIDLLARAAGGVFEDERLNAVLRGLAPAERAVVFAYAEDEGTTWTEAAAAGAGESAAFGERVRRKTHRLAAEQRRRAAQRRVSG
ncbi:hypothetical protein ACFU53_30050 [Streptomyces sp. NPDC057474]|uniref:hypothetical protein n=1 Tax=Streptomyces sp. NPDC057474 TaxID=3346144 RepID=UPI003696A1EE